MKRVVVKGQKELKLAYQQAPPYWASEQKQLSTGGIQLKK